MTKCSPLTSFTKLSLLETKVFAPRFRQARRTYHQQTEETREAKDTFYETACKNVRYQLFYEDDELVKVKVFSGDYLVAEAPVMNNSYHGEVKYYNEDLSLGMIRVYAHGQRQVTKRYHPSGRINYLHNPFNWLSFYDQDPIRPQCHEHLDNGYTLTVRNWEPT